MNPVEQNALQPLAEYPTPQFRRDSYLCLNGPWEFHVDQDPNNHSVFDYNIVVPFAVETQLSGIKRRIKKGDILHYRKLFTIPFGFRRDRILVHFEAVDQVCDVYLNGVKIAHHEGGYLPFTADCLELKAGVNELIVDVWDDTSSPVYPRGKQRERSGGIWYTPTSGIWGSVWIESVPNQLIQSLRITPDFDARSVSIAVQFEGKIEDSLVEVSLRGNVIATATLDEHAVAVIPLKNNFDPWSPERPVLYDVKVRANTDTIVSYFAMRKFSSCNWKGHTVFALNNKPYFLTGVLDQGYFQESGLTPPSDDAMIRDLSLMKNMGFNMIRKHIKIEPMRWYYHCDRLGLIVIQDMVSGGDPVKLGLFLSAPFFHWNIDDTKQYNLLGRENEEGRRFYEAEMERTVQRLYNCPCIAAWTLFNEGWGQFDSVRLTEKLRSLDPTRLIDSTSGWFDQGAGDFNSRHVYFKKVSFKDDGKRIMSLSEFGAYSHVAEGHCETKKKTFYRYFPSIESLNKAVAKLYNTQIIPMLNQGLSVAVLTQLSDVEQETNGLITFDRKVIKIRIEEIAALNRKLVFPEEEE